MGPVGSQLFPFPCTYLILGIAEFNVPFDTLYAISRKMFILGDG